MRSAIVSLALLALAGCGEPLKHLELIEDLRVLGARVEVENAPQRAAPRAGERATVRWLVASPEPAPSFGWALEACFSGSAETGIPSCGSPAFAAAESAGPATGEPSLSFDVPADSAAGARIVIQGEVCSEGPPCADIGTDVVLSFALGDENTNPELEDDSLALDGAVLPAADLIADGACGRVPSVQAGSGEHQLSLRIDDTDRDPQAAATPLDPPNESLQVTHFSTAGELDSAFSAVDGAAALAPASAQWVAPVSAPPEGLLVRFFFVARDFRGGSDWLERGVCVVP